MSQATHESAFSPAPAVALGCVIALLSALVPYLAGVNSTYLLVCGVVGAVVAGLGLWLLLAPWGRDMPQLAQACRNVPLPPHAPTPGRLTVGAALRVTHMQNEKKQCEAFLAAFARALPTPMLAFTANGQIVLDNGRLQAMLGKPDIALRGLDLTRAFQFLGDESAQLVNLLSNPHPEPVAITLHLGKNPLTLMATVLPLADCGEQPLIVAFFEDYTLTRARELALANCDKEKSDVGRAIYQLAFNMASDAEQLTFLADDRNHGAIRLHSQASSLAEAQAQAKEAISHVAHNAGNTAEATKEALEDARQGANLVRQAMEGIAGVSQTASGLAGVLSQLNGQAEQIGKVITVINEVADQTNLLALNAAIEAARAGDAGRGFAVVADEVRKLAEKTMAATKEVEHSVLVIQNTATEAVKSMEITGKRIEESTSLAAGAENAIGRIMDQVAGISERTMQIAAAAEQLSAQEEDINQSAAAIATIAGGAESGARLSGNSAHSMADSTRTLIDLSTKFVGLTPDPSKLWPAPGKMRGILPQLMSGFVAESYGRNVADAVLDTMGNPAFLPSAAFPDSVMKQMAHETSKLTNVPQREIFLALGQHTIKGFQKLYKQYMDAPDLKAFYKSMNTVHDKLSTFMPGITPPRFSFTENDNTLHMVYSSDRALFDYFEGILKAAATVFGESVKITVTPISDKQARADIVFAPRHK